MPFADVLMATSATLVAAAVASVLWLFGIVVVECVRAGFGPEPAPAPRPFHLSIDQAYRDWSPHPKGS